MCLNLPVEIGSFLLCGCSFLRTMALGNILGNNNIIMENKIQLTPMGTQPKNTEN